jgi:cell division protease FtsH
MSDRLGPLTLGRREEMIFLGREIAQHQDYSEQTAVEIDQEVRRLVMENYERAKGIITSGIQALHNLASALLEREVLDGAEIEEILKGTPEKATALSPVAVESQVIKLEPIPQHG